MNLVFKNNQFWNLFWNLEPEDIIDFDLEKQIEILSQDFTVEKEVVKDAVFYTVKFSFYCGQRFSLLLECGFSNLSLLSCNKSLQLADNLTKERVELGWWDVARWHPYCLHPEEFSLLLNYWQKFDSNWKDSKIPLLLLIHFVGFETTAQAMPFLEETEKACKLLGVNTEYLQTENWIDAIEIEKYKWSFDQSLGWTIGNEGYSCYSLRNKPHYVAVNDEESFPFKKYSKMIKDVYEILNS